MKNIFSKISNISLPVSIFFAGAFIGTAMMIAVLITSFANRYQLITPEESRFCGLFDRFTGIRYGGFIYDGNGIGRQTIYIYKSGKRIRRDVDESVEE